MVWFPKFNHIIYLFSLIFGIYFYIISEGQHIASSVNSDQLNLLYETPVVVLEIAYT